MRRTRFMTLFFLGLLCAASAQAQSLDCDAPTRVIPDGRLNGSSIPAGAVLWFSFSTSQAIASYSVEANFPQGAATMPMLAVFASGDVGPGPTCITGGSSVMTRDTTALTPEAPNGQRFSFQKTTPGMATFLIRVSNPGMAAEALTLRVAETTLFSSAWSTFGTFDTFYSFVNTTNASIDLTLKLFNTTGTEVASVNLTVPANQTLSTNTGVLMVPRSQNGSALLRHNGPTGGLLVEAAIANFAVPPGVIQPVKFQELRAAGPSGGGNGGGGGGDITAVNTMMMGGLEGGAESGEVNLSLLTSCLNGQVLKWTGTMWSCQDDSVGAGGGGDITAVNTPLAGGLEGGSVSGDANLSLNTKCATGDVLKWDGSAWVCTATPATDADGNVGIGTGASPDAALVVEATGGDAAAQFTGGPVTVSPFGPIPVDPRILFKVAGSGGVTATDRTLSVENSTTNMTTDGIDKIGLEVMSTGTFTGSGGTATVNTGLMVEVSGADINQAAVFLGGPVGINKPNPDLTKSLDIVGDVQIASELDVNGTVTALFFVGDGSGLTNLPGGGGGVSSITAGDGLTATPSNPITATGTLAVDFAGPGAATSVARSDHTHALGGAQNTGVGVGALAVNTGSDNTAMGNSALTANTTGTNNTAVGRSALANNLGANSNTAVGAFALAANTGAANTAVGASALQANNGAGNTAVGETALQMNTGGSNTAMGEGALRNTAGDDNVAIGRLALRDNNGQRNTAVGSNAMGNNVGSVASLRNTAVGFEALFNIAGGNHNTALGNDALRANTTGSNNIAIGQSAGQFATTGNDNIYVAHNGNAGESSAIRIGIQGLQTTTFIAGISGVTVSSPSTVVVDSNGQLGTVAGVASGTVTSVGSGVGLTGGPITTTGSLAVDFAGPGAATTVARSDHTHEINVGNTAVGVNALAANTSSASSTAVGANALQSSTGGDSNTAVGRDALSALTTAMSNTAVGRNALTANTASGNTAVGHNALLDNTSGTDNIAVGAGALSGNTIGNKNTALGGGALLSNTVASQNTAVGHAALFTNSTGTDNTAVGAFALRFNGTGSFNTALGVGALMDNAFGTDNTAVGSGALDDTGGASGNTAVGSNALGALAGNSNTAVGTNALATTVAGDNTAVGFNALAGTTTGVHNTAIGHGAGQNATTGSDNVYIAHDGVAAEGNTIRIGILGTQTRAFVAGIQGVTTGVADAVPVLIDSAGQLGTVSSTRRVKEDISHMGEASTALLRLRPVTFRYRQAMADGSKPLQYGLIAEEVAEVMPELVVYDAEGQPQTVQYHVFPSLLLNELQRQHAEVENLRAQLEQQRAELAELKAALRATLAKR